jgi:hypothetical protein
MMSMNDSDRFKLLTDLLQQAPESAGLTLDDDGWLDITDLLAGLERIGQPMTKEDLLRVVREQDQPILTLSDDSLRIRAAPQPDIAGFNQARRHFQTPLDMIEAMERFNLKAGDLAALLARERGVGENDIWAEIAPGMKRDED